jgi:hypothetical protein
MTTAILNMVVLIVEAFATAVLPWIKVIGPELPQEIGRAMQMILLKRKDDGILVPGLLDGSLSLLQNLHLSDL